MSRAGAGDSAASYGRGAALLSALIGVTGLLTYAFHSIAAHVLGADDYGLIAVLWAAVFLVASIIYRPVEQLLSRTIAERRARDRPIGDALRVAATIQLGLAVAFVAVALLLRDPIEDDLFSGDSTLYWCLIAAVTFYAASYFARGFLAGEQRFALYGGLVLMEASSRVVFVVLLAIGVVDSENVAAIAIAAAPLLSLFVVPWALGRHVRRMTPTPEQAAAEAGEPEFTLSHGLGFAGAVLVIMCSEQAILNSGVLIVKVETGNDELAALIFAVLMIARAPLQLFQAVSTTLLPHLTRLLVREEQGTQGLRAQRPPDRAGVPRVRRGDRGRRAARGAARDAAAVRDGVRLRPDRPGDGRGRHGPLPVGHHRQPGGAGAGPRAAGRRLVGGVGGVLRRLPAGRAAWRRCARSRSRSWRRPGCCPSCCTWPTAARPTRRAASGPGPPRSWRSGWPPRTRELSGGARRAGGAEVLARYQRTSCCSITP